MKIRTDFVTNSSSSNYIFKECDLEEIKTKLEKILDDVSVNDPKEYEFYLSAFVHDFTFWGEERAREFQALLPCFHGEPSDFSKWVTDDFFKRVRPISQLGFWELDDMDGALYHGIMEIIFYGTEQYLASGRKTHPYEHYISRIINKDISEETADKIAGYLIYDLFIHIRDLIYREPDNNDLPFSSDDEIPGVFTRELLDVAYKPFVSEALSGQDQCFDTAFVKCYKDSLYSRFQKYLGLTLGEIFERLLGKVWVFYCDCDNNYGHYVMSKEFAKLPEYLFGEDYF